MTFIQKCGLALFILVMGASLTWATGRLESGADTPPTVFLNSAVVTSDTAAKVGPGFLQCIMISMADAAPTAGTVAILDHTAAGGGTTIFSHTFTTAVFMPFQICPQRAFTAGLYIDITTSADINVSVSYR